MRTLTTEQVNILNQILNLDIPEEVQLTAQIHKRSRKLVVFMMCGDNITSLEVQRWHGPKSLAEIASQARQLAEATAEGIDLDAPYALGPEPGAVIDTSRMGRG